VRYGVGEKNKGGRNERPPLAHQRAFLHVRTMYENEGCSEIAPKRAVGVRGQKSEVRERGAKNKDGLNERPPSAHQRAFLHVRTMYESRGWSEIALNRAVKKSPRAMVTLPRRSSGFLHLQHNAAQLVCRQVDPPSKSYKLFIVCDVDRGESQLLQVPAQHFEGTDDSAG